MSSSILILHATVGTGHKTAALALEKAFKRRGAERVWVQDTLDYGSGLFRRLYANLYIDLSEKTPELWGFAYHESNREQSRFERQLRQLYSRIGIYKVDELNHLRPDAILCTHFLPIDAALNSLAPAGLKAPVFCVVTDFVGHPFWAHPGIAGTFVGNAMTADMLVSHGVPRQSLHVTGIPVNPDIAFPKNVAAIREQRLLGKGPVITLIGSGIEDDKVRRMAEGILAREIEGTLCIVAGRNYTLQQHLVGLHGSARLELRVLGFIDYLDDLIAASDLVITKSGGLITSEVMARGTPLLVTEPIRGQEEFNADYVVTAGVGVQARLTDSVPYMVESLVADTPRLAQMRRHAALYGRPDAALAVADIVLNTINRAMPYGNYETRSRQ
jgi:processive 1,2-diacylglycerol beta-glucosyltransferase